jgi:two-component system, sensor histidine kinase and response regulator
MIQQDLWSFLKKREILNQNIGDFIFKRKAPTKRHIQVKASLINNETQLIVFFNDITRIKELESTSIKLRSMFFSSVAHELRTPLNSIIPMTKILQGIVSDPRSLKFLEIILNSALHL